VLAALSYAHKQNVSIATSSREHDADAKRRDQTDDFGIARSSNDLGLTVTGTTVGSLAYMSRNK